MSSAFADTHNMVSILTKSEEIEGFDQIIDFLNGSYIKYALTVNPHIYMSFIKQFWNTVTVKQSNDVTRLQALVDRKKVVILEDVIRDALRLADAEGVDCVPNKEIFTGLARMGKFNFSKYIFDSLVRDVDSSSKVYMYPRVETPLFEGMLVAGEPEEQGDTDEQEALDACASLTRRVEHLEHDKVAQDLEITKLKTRVKKLERANKGRMIDELARDEGVALMGEKEEEKKAKEVKVIAGDAQVEGRQAEIQAEIYQIDMDHPIKVLSMQEDEPEVTLVSAASTIIPAAEPKIHAATITAAPVKVDAAFTRRRRGVVIRDPEEELPAKVPDETKSKDKGKGIMVEEQKPIKKKQQVELDEVYARKLHEELNQDIDWEVAIDHVKQKAKEDLYVQRYQLMMKRPQTEAHARRNMIMYLKNTTGFRLDYFKGMSYDDIRPIFEAKFNSNIEFLLKSKEQIEEEENRALESINKTLAQKAAKRRRMNDEVKDVEEIKQHLEIMPNKDDDVYTEATPLARKVPVVDYQIIQLNNKPRYKIIRADGTDQLYSNVWKTKWTRLSLEESKKCSWSSKKLEAAGIVWCSHHIIYNHSADFAIRKKIPTLEVYTRSNAKCSETSSGRAE
uniref:Xylulose kinase-1 n=1 Tax=Tanacetum cinerariifolium TaxID=118510 RepID=A0A6L2LPN3_TANCI|nr:hypothetical protein [Tanacetum cinerariifolium]